jgi:hypothetical protein
VCGFLASEDGYNPLIATLPRLLKLDVRAGTSRDWIEASVRFAARELAEGRLASSSVMHAFPNCCSSRQSGNTLPRSPTRRSGG